MFDVQEFFDIFDVIVIDVMVVQMEIVDFEIDFVNFCGQLVVNQFVDLIGVLMKVQSICVVFDVVVVNVLSFLFVFEFVFVFVSMMVEMFVSDVGGEGDIFVL